MRPEKKVEGKKINDFVRGCFLTDFSVTSNDRISEEKERERETPRFLSIFKTFAYFFDKVPKMYVDFWAARK